MRKLVFVLLLFVASTALAQSGADDHVRVKTSYAQLDSIKEITPTPVRFLVWNPVDSTVAWYADAPSDGKQYVRLNGAWAEVSGQVYPSSGVAVSNGSTWSASLANTTVGTNFLTATNPSAITYPQVSASNTVSFLSGSSLRSAIGAGTMSNFYFCQEGEFGGSGYNVGGGGAIGVFGADGVKAVRSNWWITNSLDFDGLTAGTPTYNDEFSFYDLSAGDHKKITLMGLGQIPYFNAIYLYNYPLGADIPAAGESLVYDGTYWRPQTVSGSLSDGDKGDITVGSSGTDWQIDAGVVGSTELDNSGVTAGSYTNASITVGADGRVTSASSGSVSGDYARVISISTGGGSGTTMNNMASASLTYTIFQVDIGVLSSGSFYGHGTTTFFCYYNGSTYSVVSDSQGSLGSGVSLTVGQSGGYYNLTVSNSSGSTVTVFYTAHLIQSRN